MHELGQHSRAGRGRDHPADPARQARAARLDAAALGSQPRRRLHRRGRDLARTIPPWSTSSARSPSPRSIAAPTRSPTRSPTPASRRATAWRSCAATTAASWSPPWRWPSSAHTRSTSTPRSPARSSPRWCSGRSRWRSSTTRSSPSLLEDAGKRRKRFIAWHDSDDPADPTLEDLIADGPTEQPVPPAEPGKAIILTSGTTGTPKGANRASPASLDPATALLSRIPLHSRQTTHIAAPLFHSWGFAHFTIGLLLSSTMVLARKFDPENCLALIERTRAESLVVVPVMMQRILDLDEETRRRYDVSSLKVVAASGSALPGRPGHGVDGRVRRQPLQPLRLHRGGLGHDRHARGHARRSGHRRQAAARHGAQALRREGHGGAPGRDRAASSWATRCSSRATRAADRRTRSTA